MFLGIEIGGTKLQLAVGPGDGSPLVARERTVVDPHRGADGIREQIRHLGGRLLAQHPIDGIGIGFGGPVDAAAGRVVTSHQISGWTDFPLMDWCRQTFHLPAVLGNDCDAAALAEARFGAGRGRRVVFYVTVGTGVGGGLVLDGRLHESAGLASAEIGHLRPGLDCVRADQTVESLASGRGIETAARNALSDLADDAMAVAQSGIHPTSPDSVGMPTEFADEGRLDLLARCGGDPDFLTTKQIAAAAADGNALALHILSQAARTLGWALAQVVTLLAPDILVIGGGVSLMGEELFFAPVRTETSRYVFPPLADAYEIAPAALGEDVVLHGALALAAG